MIKVFSFEAKSELLEAPDKIWSSVGRVGGTYFDPFTVHPCWVLSVKVAKVRLNILSAPPATAVPGAAGLVRGTRVASSRAVPLSAGGLEVGSVAAAPT